MKETYRRYLLEGKDSKLLIPPLYIYNSKETTGFPYIYIMKEYNNKKKKPLELSFFH